MSETCISSNLFFKYMHAKRNEQSIPTTVQQDKLINDVIGQLAGGCAVVLLSDAGVPVCRVRKAGSIREYHCVIV